VPCTKEDVIKKRSRMALRPKGAGAQFLLLALLNGAKARLDHLMAGAGLSDRVRGYDLAEAGNVRFVV